MIQDKNSVSLKALNELHVILSRSKAEAKNPYDGTYKFDTS
jgi:hypothetical protein